MTTLVLGERCRLRTCVLRDEDAADVSMDRAWTNAMHAVRAYASRRLPGHVHGSTRRDTRQSGGQGVAGSNPVSPTRVSAGQERARHSEHGDVQDTCKIEVLLLARAPPECARGPSRTSRAPRSVKGDVHRGGHADQKRERACTLAPPGGNKLNAHAELAVTPGRRGSFGEPSAISLHSDAPGRRRKDALSLVSPTGEN